MANLKNLEIINISTNKGKLVAILSYKDTDVNDLNYGYSIMEVPVNIRELQLSPRGNVLVNQSLGRDEGLNEYPSKNLKS